MTQGESAAYKCSCDTPGGRTVLDEHECVRNRKREEICWSVQKGQKVVTEHNNTQRIYYRDAKQQQSWKELKSAAGCWVMASPQILITVI